MSHTSVQARANAAAQATVTSAADIVLAQANALVEYRNALRHVGCLQKFVAEETQRRQVRLLAARGKLIEVGCQHILDEIESNEKKAGHGHG